MFEYGTSLFQGDAREPLNEIGDLGTVFEVLEERGDRNSSAAKDPSPADPLGIALDHRA
jgi:hypothetical protein